MATQRVGPMKDGEPGEPCADYAGLALLGDGLPVACVTWCEAARFANALSLMEGLDPVYQGLEACEAGTSPAWNRSVDGWRLPTEAEWEVAARAGDRHVLFAGSFHDDGDRACSELYRYANVADPAFAAVFPDIKVVGLGEARRLVDPRSESVELQDDGYAGLAPVGSYKPNAWGLHDMSGNLREWTWDVYDPSPSQDPVTDPAGPPSGPVRAYRGSAFDDASTGLRIANRGYDGPGQRNIFVGLRLARSMGVEHESE